MMYTPRSYLMFAVSTLVALQMHAVSATSLSFDPVTTSGTTDKISSKFPGYGGEIADEDCAVTVEVDPTLPDIATISLVPVTYTEFLANASTPPTEPLFTKLGIATLSEVSSLDSTATATGLRRLEANPNTDIAKLEDYFNVTMETTLANLPTEGLYDPAPWPASNWPTYKDSINAVWREGEMSPAEKYALAFGLNVSNFMDWVSWESGIDSMSDRKNCTLDSDCAPLDNDSKCGIRINQTSGYCIPSWEGICHAWAPAAILEEEPRCPVTYNNVTFLPMDVKALLSDVYNGADIPLVFTGARYNGKENSKDEYGRHLDDSHRDVNPAFFHIVTANLLGKLNTTFIADIDAGYEVWNQPMRGFKVHEQTAMSLEEAAQTFYGLQEYPWNAAAKNIVYLKTHLSWIDLTYDDGPLVSTGKIDKYTAGAYYHYLLELDDAGRIIGGEWLYDSNSNHLDFLWVPTAKPAEDTMTEIGLSYAEVNILLEQSVACTDSPQLK